MKRDIGTKNFKDFDFYNNLGLAYLKLEEFEKAQHNFFAAHNLNSSMPNVNANLAELFIKYRNFEEADKYLNMSLAKIFDIDKKYQVNIQMYFY